MTPAGEASCCSYGPDALQLTVSGDGSKPDHHHDPSHCPVCQVISLSSSFAILHHDTVLCVLFRSPEVLTGLFNEKLRSRFFSSFAARAPPNLT